ncbi:MAG TPA: glycosyltransferase family 2 protein, partial [Acidimicrobiales bacterium]|nr:glycosyltransferase family 2 protein [Acidimicrobiales bacterium]
MPNTSVVVLSQNPGQWLDACLDSAEEQADEVVVIDNGSPNRGASRIGETHGARVVRSETNLGYAAGVNLGIRESSGDIVALLNDDAVAGPEWLSSAAATLADPRVACVVPKVIRHGWYREVLLNDVHEAPRDHRDLGTRLVSVTSNGLEVLERLLGPGIYQLEGSVGTASGLWRWTAPRVPFYVPVENPDADKVVINGEPAPTGAVCRLLNKAGGYLLDNGVLGDVGDESPDDGRWDKPSEPFFGSGTALVTTRDAIDRIGGLAEPYFAYYEDGDWCWRARLCGLT